MSRTPQSINGVAATFVERLVQVDGVGIRYLEAGQGSPVVVLHGAEGLTQPPLLTLLAQHFQVIALEIPAFGRLPVEGRSSSMRNVAHTLARAATAAGIDHYVLVSTTDSAPFALWQAIEATEGVDALVLLSPTASGFTSDPELERRLGEMQTPTLILIGTNDTTIPPETGCLYVERMPNCYYTLVYDAGQAIAAERPEALLAAVCDFVERRGAFIVERNSTAVNP